MKKTLSLIITSASSTLLLPVLAVISLAMVTGNIEEDIKNHNIGRWDFTLSVDEFLKKDPFFTYEKMKFPLPDHQYYKYEVDEVNERIRLFEEKKQEMLDPDRPNILDKNF